MAEGGPELTGLDARALLAQFLQSQGVKPTNANVSAALAQNAREPGYVPGLNNSMAPIVSPGDPGFVGPTPAPRSSPVPANLDRGKVAPRAPGRKFSGAVDKPD